MSCISKDAMDIALYRYSNAAWMQIRRKHSDFMSAVKSKDSDPQGLEQ